MKKFYPLILVLSGIFLIAAGVIYGGVFAGLPGPDDSPAQAARVSLHGNIAFGGVCLGVLTFLVGAGAVVLRLLARGRRRHQA